MQTTLKNHLAGELLTTATCWKLMLAGGEVMGFTDYDEDLNIRLLSKLEEGV
ncbi:MAG: DUF2163 domain-containing protein [Wolbachia sp.]